MEKHLIFVYSAYIFSFFVLFFIAINSYLSLKRSRKNINEFSDDSKTINNKK